MTRDGLGIVEPTLSLCRPLLRQAQDRLSRGKANDPLNGFAIFFGPLVRGRQSL